MIAIVRAARTLVGIKGLGLKAFDPDEPRSGARADDHKVLLATGSGYRDLHEFEPPITDQGSASSCVGDSIAAMVAISESVHELPFDPPSADAIYRQSVEAHTPKGAKLEDSGTYIRVAMSELGRKGAAPLEAFPRSRFRNPLAPVPAHARSEGFNRRGLSYKFVVTRSIADELDQVDAAIRALSPAGFGWNITERYMRHSSSAPYDARLRKSDVVRGGHMQVQVSTRDNFGVVRLRNSWGDWCDGGYINVIGETMARRDIVIANGWERLINA
jgi:hypothetical protein